MATTIGVAGMTGKFASLVLDRLLDRPRVSIRGFCRNIAKLPDRVRSSPRVTVVVGGAFDDEAARRFVRGCDVVVCCYLGDGALMEDGQKLLVDACDLEGVPRYVASDYCFDYGKLEYGQHPAKDPMKRVKAHVETKRNVCGVHVLVGVFMETFWSGAFGLFDATECKFSFHGSGDEVWGATTYGAAADYTAEVALDKDAVGTFHFLGDRKSIRQIADEFAEVYGRKPALERRGSLSDLYETMQATFRESLSDNFAWISMFYHYYYTTGQACLKESLDNGRYPNVKPVTYRQFMEFHDPAALGGAWDRVGSTP